MPGVFVWEAPHTAGRRSAPRLQRNFGRLRVPQPLQLRDLNRGRLNRGHGPRPGFQVRHFVAHRFLGH
jgi:hypothetical protein